MQVLIKSSIKIIGRHPNGYWFSHLVNKLQKSDIIEFEAEQLLDKIKQIKQLTIQVEKDGDYLIVAEQHIQHHYQKKNIFEEMYTENNTKEILKQIYEIIVKNGEEGTNYQQIKLKYNKRQKKYQLEITMISHYCRRLYEMHLIKIQTDINQKRVFARIFFQKQYQFEINNQKKKKKNNKQIIDDIQFSKSNIDQIETEKWKAFGKHKFVFRELNFDENMKINLMSAQAVQQQGLYMEQIFRRMNKFHEKKMIQKIILQFQQQYQQENNQKLDYQSNNFFFQTNAIRRGKTYSLKYYFNNSHFQQYLNQFLIGDALSVKQDSVPKDNSQQVQVDEINEDSNNFIGTLNNFELEYLNETCFNFLRRILLQDVQLYERFQLQITNQMQKFKGIQQDWLYTQTMVDFKDKEQFLIPNKKMYEQITLAMLKIIFEQYEQKENKNNINNMNVDVNLNYRFSKRQVSLQKIQRYIMIMNQLLDEKIIPMFRIKKKIIINERNNEEVFTGKIDRKTLQIMINALEEIGLIKQCFRKMCIQQEGINCQQNRNNIVLYHEISEDDPRIQQIIDKYVTFKDIKEEFSDRKQDSFQMNLRKKVKKDIQFPSMKKEELQMAYEEAVRNKQQDRMKEILQQSKESSIELKLKIFTNEFDELKKRVQTRMMKELFGQMRQYYNGLELVQDIDNLQLSSVYVSSYKMFKSEIIDESQQCHQSSHKPLVFKDIAQIDSEIDIKMIQERTFNYKTYNKIIGKTCQKEKKSLEYTQLYQLLKDNSRNEVAKQNIRFQQAIHKLLLYVLRYPCGYVSQLKLKMNNDFCIDDKQIGYGNVMQILQQIGMISFSREGKSFSQWNEIDYSYAFLKQIRYQQEKAFLNVI